MGLWNDDELALGHRRLAIIGLEAEGRQPRLRQNGDSVLIFNGEIYNYLELANELEAAGHPVDRRFDTDVLQAALEAWGVGALERLNGMFALAWYRPRAKRLVLARDRWGKKPLFWGRVPVGAQHHPALVFGSELRLFTHLPGGPPPPNPLGVARYLLYGGMPGTETVYRGVHKVGAAAWIELDPTGTVLAEGRYWTFRRRPQAMSLDHAVERCESLVLDALRLRLRSDVPVGLFLSGGIDSSLLAWAWQKIAPQTPISTFTVGFDDPSYDERRFAAEMADRVGSRHLAVVVDEPRLLEELDRVWQHLDEPFADASVVPTSLVSRIAAEHVRVAIGGDGGDEHQAGYDPFRAWMPARWLRGALGPLAAPLVRGLERLSPISDRNLSLRFKLHHFGRGLGLPPPTRLQGWLAPFAPGDLGRILDPDLAVGLDLDEVLEPTRLAYQAHQPQGDLSAQIEMWVATYLETAILTKVDRASMMHSLEVRAPFLDPALTEFFAELPDELVFHRGRGKVLLRALAKRHLPPALAHRPKKGFGIPVGRWLRTALRPRVEACLDRREPDGWFNRDAIRAMWQAHLDRRGEYRQELWAYLMSFPFRSG
jgi:asparagine synthase (glutamine-hydrolysing)